MVKGGKIVVRDAKARGDKITLMRLLISTDAGKEVRMAAWRALQSESLLANLGSSGLCWVTRRAIDDEVRVKADRMLQFGHGNIIAFYPQSSPSAVRTDSDGLVIAAVR